MAKMDTDGMIETTAMLDAAANIPAEEAEALLFAGGDILVKHLKQQAARHVHTGLMQRNIRYKRKVLEDKSGAKYISVTAEGTETRKKGRMSNAQKAFWANYGTSKQKGSRFWQIAEKKAEAEIQGKFDAMTDQIYIKRGVK